MKECYLLVETQQFHKKFLNSSIFLEITNMELKKSQINIQQTTCDILPIFCRAYGASWVCFAQLNIESLKMFHNCYYDLMWLGTIKEQKTQIVVSTETF